MSAHSTCWRIAAVCFASVVAPLAAQTWTLADPEAVHARLSEYVDQHRNAPGVVVGLLDFSAPAGQRTRFISQGVSGRAGVRLDRDTQFEIGSISKGLTGLLLAEMVVAGEVRLESSVGALVPSPNGPWPEHVAAITLEQLATHCSGLPRLPLHPIDLAPLLLRSDPYAGSTPSSVLLAASRSAGRKPAGNFAYSNLGYAVLGQTLAAAAGEPFNQLLEERVLRRYGMREATLSPDDAAAGRLARGVAANHWPAAHWHLDGYSPAGGVIASATDLLTFFERVLEKPTPAWIMATTPRRPVDQSGRHIGLGWMLRRGDNGTLVSHSGGTGGFRTFAAVVPERQIAVVVLTNGSMRADLLGLSLIEAGRKGPEARRTSWLQVMLGCLGIVFGPAMLAAELRSGIGTKAPRRSRDRIDALVAIFAAILFAEVSTRLAPWYVIPVALWWVATAVVTVLSGWLLFGRLRSRSWLTGSGWSRAWRIAMLGTLALPTALLIW